jgi:hypothetical protein
MTNGTNQYSEENERDLMRSYLIQRDQFRDQKKKLLWKIESLKSQGDNKFQINKLEREIQLIRPRTRNGRLICSHCDCVSMMYRGRKYSAFFKKETLVYGCEICGRKEKY